MAILNFILQGKGGVGKSLVAFLLFQYHQEQKNNVLGFDTDPVNASFCSFPAFKAKHVELLENGEIKPTAFDGFIETLLSIPEETQVIIDNGASTFLPLCWYLNETNVVDILVEQGHEVLFHTIIAGGQGLLDTMNGLETLIINFPKVPVVVWQNEYFGLAEMHETRFENSKLFASSQDHIHAFIPLPLLHQATFGVDMERMLRQRLTFKEAITSIDFHIMSRQRLKTAWRRIDDQIKLANL